jgi:hypothetical protein
VFIKNEKEFTKADVNMNESLTVMLSSKKILTSANIVANRLFPERYFFQKSWAFDY